MNGTEELKDEDNVTAVAFAHHAMWKNVTFQISEQIVAADPINGYPLKSYIENRFTFSDASRQSSNDLLFSNPDTPVSSLVRVIDYGSNCLDSG